MTKLQQGQATAYVRTIADTMGLRDWRVEVLAEEPPEADTLADVEVIHGKRCSRIRFAQRSITGDAADLRRTVVHELLHCHLDSSERVVFCDIADAKLIPMPMYQSLCNTYRRIQEEAIDGMADAWAQWMPLPVISLE